MVAIVTIDGPSGSGKGTIAGMLAERLGWACLDSGALYRLAGLVAERAGIGADQPEKLAEMARNMPVEFRPDGIYLGDEDVSLSIRTESAGNAASRVAAVPAVREALLDWQRNYAREPGLVADGRDMGTTVFPAAGLKIFLDASAGERAKRRYKQLKEKGFDASLADLISEIEERDQRDRNRPVSPLRPADDAVVIDSSRMGIDEVMQKVLELVAQAFPETGNN